MIVVILVQSCLIGKIYQFIGTGQLNPAQQLQALLLSSSVFAVNMVVDILTAAVRRNKWYLSIHLSEVNAFTLQSPIPISCWLRPFVFESIFRGHLFLLMTFVGWSGCNLLSRNLLLFFCKVPPGIENVFQFLGWYLRLEWLCHRRVGWNGDSGREAPLANLTEHSNNHVIL